MFLNYLTIAWRNIIRYKWYSVLNILGLSIGIALFFLSFIFVKYETSFDTFQSKSESIYRVHQKFNDGGTTARISIPIKDALLSDYPEITQATSFFMGNGGRVTVGENRVEEEGFLFIDQAFFEVFDIDFIKGNKEAAKKAFASTKNQVYITHETAQRLFGEQDPLGKTISIQQLGETEFIISGIVEKYPDQSHFHFKYLLPIAALDSFLKEEEDNFNNPMVYTYLLIPDKEKAQAIIDGRLEDFVHRHFEPQYAKGAYLPVIPIKDIHLNSRLYFELETNSDVTMVYIVFVVGILILFLAAINFTNLATARSVKRAKEVGVRKSMGAYRQSLVIQFIGEAVIYSFISVLVGVILAELFLPYFNALLNRDFNITYFDNFKTIPTLVLIGLVVGFLAGSYPALYLSSFNPVKALKNAGIKSPGGVMIRKGLVVLQFAVVTFLLVGIIALGKQLNFMINKDLGYDYKNLVSLRSSDKMMEQPESYKAFFKELERNPYVNHIAGVSSWTYNTVVHEGMDPQARKGINMITASDSYAQVMGLQLLQGRLPSKEIKSDTAAIVINETAVKNFGWTAADAIGKYIDLVDGGGGKHTVIGVVKDYHTASLAQAIEPLGIRATREEVFGFNVVSISSTNRQAGIDAVKTTWKKFDDGWPFDVQLNGDEIEEQYKFLFDLNKLMMGFTTLSIIVACLGLFGLAAFSAERRTKEIGIRKALGASVMNLWQLLVSEYAILVLIATVIGSFIGYGLVDLLMSNFVYKTQIGLLVYLGAIFFSIFIAVSTVSYQAIKSAMLNPVKTLRTD
mgnify:CR=1 FL=1